MIVSHYLYTSEQCRELDRLAIEEFHIPGYELMNRAGQAVFDYIHLYYPDISSLVIFCGAGNNGGDGYIVARLAKHAGFNVTVVSLCDTSQLNNDAQTAFEDWLSAGGDIQDINTVEIAEFDLIVDAILGTGLQRDVSGHWYDCIEQINQAGVPVIAVDVPSGLNADTGRVMGSAVRAKSTLSFIGMKRGLFTGQARDFAGDVVFNDLIVPGDVYQQVEHQVELLDDELNLPTRLKTAHKGQAGHVVIVGGDYGMAGAVLLSAKAALRCGAGLVTVVTRPEHVSIITSNQPEIMVHAIDEEQDIDEVLLDKATAIAVGPGLGRNSWGRRLLNQVLDCDQSKIIDADALHHLVHIPANLDKAVITPHPGEAAVLLDCSVDEIEQDRFSAITRLNDEYGATVVLKGAGSLVYDGFGYINVCPYGNPGMATAGMGDMLTGIIAALIAQGMDHIKAATSGVCLHALAADDASQHAERGMIATDLLPAIRQRVNP